jgi:glycogen(starch) synthase
MLGWELPPHNSGGLGVACYHMSKALALQGASIDFVVPYTAHHPDADFMTIHSATKLGPLERYGLMGAYDSKYLRQLGLDEVDGGDLYDMRGVQKRYVQYVEEMVKDKAPDAIHAHDWLTMEAGMRAKEITGSPLIVHVHATEFDRSGEKYGNPIVHEIEYQGLMMADRIIAVSNITKSIIMQKYAIPADKIDVVYNAIDVASLGTYDYNHCTYKYLESLKEEGYTVVATVTRFTIQKGLTHFIRAAARASEKHDRLVFLLAGDGEQRDELIRLGAELGIADKLFFTGFVRGKQWRDAYNVADIFVMSSVSEPFGLTALEAAHHDSALIVTRQSGVGEILGNIFRYDFWDTDVLADQIVGIATSPALQQDLKENVKHEYARISWHDVANQCMQLYQRVREGSVV